MKLFLGAVLATFTLVGCGDCPPSKVVPALEARNVTNEYDVHPDGRVTLDGMTVYTCDADCRALLASADTTCEEACDAIGDREPARTSCGFRADRKTLTCKLHYDAQPEGCNCSIVDC